LRRDIAIPLDGELRLLVEALGPRRLMLGAAHPLQNPCVAALKLALSGLSILQEIGERNAARVLRVWGPASS
ncbi:MAG: hypothetical protein DRK00_08665, partial [Thermoprotei archaeon]